jgi:DNA topoisomerase-1
MRLGHGTAGYPRPVLPAATAPPEVADERLDEARETARDAGLRYVSDQAPGLRRRRRGEHFSYHGPDGKPIRDEAALARIRALAIPPAWTDVWISPPPNGHIQATGRDARGRKQYRYHDRWREVRDEDKYERLLDFAKALPKVRRRVARDMKRRGLPREKVLATVIRLLETTLIRVGNEEYARENRSFGLTTLRRRHTRVRGSHVGFIFRGKSGKEHEVGIENRAIARIVKQCQELPGQELFQYRDADGTRGSIDSEDVNEYLRETAGQDFTAKDFRTWAGTVLAAQALQELEQFDSEAQAKRNVLEAIEKVAGQLGNTCAVCRQCYVHPAIVDAYMDGTMVEVLQKRAEAAIQTGLRRLSPEEAAVLAILQQRLKRTARSRRKAA